MKLSKLVTLLILCPRILGGQNTSPEQHLTTPEEMITTIIATGMFEGGMQKQIGRMGDAAAATITRVFAGRNLARTGINAALEIITSSFADPRYVTIESDRQPRTTLLLLRYLDFWTNDPAVKQDIAHTRKYVEDQYKKSLEPAH